MKWEKGELGDAVSFRGGGTPRKDVPDYWADEIPWATVGSMKNISKPKLLGLSIPLPPLDLRRRFAAIVEAVERQKARQRAHLAELDTLFAALQQRAFTGEL